MDDIFASLTCGAKFNKNKIKETVRIFSGRNDSGELSSSRQSILDIMEGKGSIVKMQRRVPSEDEPRSNHVDSDQLHSGQRSESNFEREEDLNCFRNRLAIKVKGEDVPHPVADFQSMAVCGDLKPSLLRNIEVSTWKEPTAIQMQAIPALLSGRDVLAAAPTGSGKTAAFVIPILSKLSSTMRGTKKTSKDIGGVRGLILAPTRELAEQIHRESVRLGTGRRIKISLLSKSTATAALERQDKSLFAGVDLLVATPMRLLGVLRGSTALDLSRVQIVVLDEADKLFEFTAEKSSMASDGDTGDRDDDEGNGPDGNGDADAEEQPEAISSSFLNQVDEILAECPDSGVQKALFSATIGPFVEELAANILKNPVSVTVGTVNAGASTIDQRLVFVGREDGKLLAMRQLIQQGLKPPVLIFMQSKERAKELFLELVYDGINVDAIHAERTQQQREEVIRRFRMGEIWVLICTDLMARGVDFKGVQMVINYDLPQSAVAYIHRIGRTGRAGKTGTAVTFFTEDDMPRMRPIANVMRLSGCSVPDWMLNLKQMKTKEKRQLRQRAPERRSISTESSYDRQREAKKAQIVNQSREQSKKKQQHQQQQQQQQEEEGRSAEIKESRRITKQPRDQQSSSNRQQQQQEQQEQSSEVDGKKSKRRKLSKEMID